MVDRILYVLLYAACAEMCFFMLHVQEFNISFHGKDANLKRPFA